MGLILRHWLILRFSCLVCVMFTINSVIAYELKYATQDTNYSICCPFHNDRTPSMRVYPDSDDGVGSCYCFACGKTWIPYTFIRDLKGFSSRFEVAAYVRDVYGVTLDFSVEKVTNPLWDKVSILYPHVLTVGELNRFEHALLMHLRGDALEMDSMISHYLKEGI